MPGGLIELVAKSSQDFYLTNNPQITFFKSVYRRHTNFSMEYIHQEFTTSPLLSTTNSTRINVVIERNGDLLYDSYLVFDLPKIYTDRLSNFQWIPNIAQRILDHVEVTVGGQRIDIQYGQWMNIWNELTLEIGKKCSYNKMIGKDQPQLRPQVYHTDDTAIIPQTRLRLPFNFWFCQNPGLALPLLALQYTPVMFFLEFNPLNELFTIGRNPALAPGEFFTMYCNEVCGSTAQCQVGVVNDACGVAASSGCGRVPISDENAQLYQQLTQEGWIARDVIWRYINGNDANADQIWKMSTFLELNYIFLDTEERRRVALVTHEYLITQINRRFFTGLMTGTNIIELVLANPTKLLLWVFQRQDIYRTNDWFNYTAISGLNQYLETQKISLQNSHLLQNEHMGDREFLDSDETQQFIKCIALQNIEVNNPDNHLNIMKSAKLIFNGNDRFEEKDYDFFNALQPFKYFTSCAPHGVQVYSFGLSPESEQPSGTVNLSAINRTQLFTRLKKIRNEPNIEYNLTVYSHSFNVFRIMGGIGGTAFINS